jgi:O-antigen ligase
VVAGAAVVAVALALLVIAVVAIPSRVLAKISAPITALQVNSVLGSLSLGGMLSLFLLPVTVIRSRRSDYRGVVALLLALLAWNVIYLVRDNNAEAQYAVLDLCRLLALVLLSVQVSRSDPTILRSMMRFLAPLVLAQSAAIGVFRLFPAIEESYWLSPIAPYLSGAKVAELFTTATNNVVEPEKAGGIFLNGNTASAVAGLCACLFAAFAVRFRSRAFGLVALVAWASIFFCGSKTGIALGVLVPAVAAMLFVVLPAKRRVVSRATALVVGLPAGLFGVSLLLDNSPDYVADTGDSIAIRSRIWTIATDLIREHPLSGAGFGGFTEATTLRATELLVPAGYPAHNFLLTEWMNTGLVGVLLVVAIFVYLAVQSITTIVRGDRAASLAAALTFGGALWLFIHGMGDNTAFFGMQNSMILFGIMVALSASLHAGLRRDSNAGSAEATGPQVADREAVLV